MEPEEERSVSLGTDLPPPSPLTGCYLLVVIGEPHDEQHKEIILQRLLKGFLSWDSNENHVDLEKELATLTAASPDGEEARNGERLIQFATENLVTEVLVHPQMNTLMQCMRNLLSSFTRHRHIIHAGYTFAGNGSWIMQDGTFSLADFTDAFQENEVQRVIRAYENTITIDIHCAANGAWTRLPAQPYAQQCRIRVNPTDILDSGSTQIKEFVDYVDKFVVPASIEQLLVSSDVVGNIRFAHPTLYVFPGGQGDAALFGINGFNMLVDGGFSRKACWWDFARHLDRLDAVLFTRLNNCSAAGMGAVLRRKATAQVYPQIGHFFCNLEARGEAGSASPDGDKDADPLLASLLQQGGDMMDSLRAINLRPQNCYRGTEPVNLYHKVGHGTLDMYVLNPSKDSKYVREFLHKWHSNDQKLFEGATASGSNQFSFPVPNLVSICALLVWRPANPDDNVTRIMFPGSTPQHKIFEGLDRLKHLEFLRTPICTGRQIAAAVAAVAPPVPPVVPAPTAPIVRSVRHVATRGSKERSVYPEKTAEDKTTVDKLTEPPRKDESLIKDDIEADREVIDNKVLTELADAQEGKLESVLRESLVSRAETNLFDEKSKGDILIEKVALKRHKESKKKDKIILEKKLIRAEETKESAINKAADTKKNYIDIKSKVESKRKTESRVKTETSTAISRTKITTKTVSKNFDRKSTGLLEKRRDGEEKSPPMTPRKDNELKSTQASKELPKEKIKVRSKKFSPSSTPAKSTKEANNRRVAESKYKQSSPKRDISQKGPEKKEIIKAKREPISRRPKPVSSPVKGMRSLKSPSKTLKSFDKGKMPPPIRSSVRDYEDILKDSKKSDEETSKSIDDVKQQEIDEREEQEIVREIEAVFNRDSEAEERQEFIARSDIEQIRDVLDDMKTDGGLDGEFEEEYLIIEKEEIDQFTEDSINEHEVSREKEDEMQKHLRDTEESEKKLNKNVAATDPDIRVESTDIAKICEDHSTKDKKGEEISTSFEEKQDGSSEKKTSDSKEDMCVSKPKDSIEAINVVLESQPDEKISTTVESGATTAPTLPEDERITLDEIKEDQRIEEKHTLEETKEIIPPNTIEIKSSIPILLSSKLEPKTAPIREVVKTPDEVADLPLHEEADYRTFDDLAAAKKTDQITKQHLKKLNLEDDVFRRKPDLGFIHEIKVPSDLPLNEVKQEMSKRYAGIQDHVVVKTMQAPLHAELVTVTPGSAPESPGYIQAHAKDVIPGTSMESIKETDRSSTIKEEFAHYGFALRETHITTLDSPIKEEVHITEEIQAISDKIHSIPEDIETEMEETAKNYSGISKYTEKNLPERQDNDFETYSTVLQGDALELVRTPVDVEKIVADVAEVLKSDKSLEEIMSGKTTPLAGLEDKGGEHKQEGTKLTLSTEIVDTTTDIDKSTKSIERMLVTASSEDGGHETEICSSYKVDILQPENLASTEDLHLEDKKSEEVKEKFTIKEDETQKSPLPKDVHTVGVTGINSIRKMSSKDEVSPTDTLKKSPIKNVFGAESLSHEEDEEKATKDEPESIQKMPEVSTKDTRSEEDSIVATDDGASKNTLTKSPSKEVLSDKSPPYEDNEPKHTIEKTESIRKLSAVSTKDTTPEEEIEKSSAIKEDQIIISPTIKNINEKGMSADEAIKKMSIESTVEVIPKYTPSKSSIKDDLSDKSPTPKDEEPKPTDEKAELIRKLSVVSTQDTTLEREEMENSTAIKVEQTIISPFIDDRNKQAISSDEIIRKMSTISTGEGTPRDTLTESPIKDVPNDILPSHKDDEDIPAEEKSDSIRKLSVVSTKDTESKEGIEKPSDIKGEQKITSPLLEDNDKKEIAADESICKMAIVSIDTHKLPKDTPTKSPIKDDFNDKSPHQDEEGKPTGDETESIRKLSVVSTKDTAPKEVNEKSSEINEDQKMYSPLLDERDKTKILASENNLKISTITAEDVILKEKLISPIKDIKENLKSSASNEEHTIISSLIEDREKIAISADDTKRKMSIPSTDNVTPKDTITKSPIISDKSPTHGEDVGDPSDEKPKSIRKLSAVSTENTTSKEEIEKSSSPTSKTTSPFLDDKDITTIAAEENIRKMSIISTDEVTPQHTPSKSLIKDVLSDKSQSRLDDDPKPSDEKAELIRKLSVVSTKDTTPEEEIEKSSAIKEDQLVISPTKDTTFKEETEKPLDIIGVNKAKSPLHEDKGDKTKITADENIRKMSIISTHDTKELTTKDTSPKSPIKDVLGDKTPSRLEDEQKPLDEETELIRKLSVVSTKDKTPEEDEIEKSLAIKVEQAIISPFIEDKDVLAEEMIRKMSMINTDDVTTGDTVTKSPIKDVVNDKLMSHKDDESTPADEKSDVIRKVSLVSTKNETLQEEIGKHSELKEQEIKSLLIDKTEMAAVKNINILPMVIPDHATPKEKSLIKDGFIDKSPSHEDDIQKLKGEKVESSRKLSMVSLMDATSEQEIEKSTAIKEDQTIISQLIVGEEEKSISADETISKKSIVSKDEVTPKDTLTKSPIIDVLYDISPSHTDNEGEHAEEESKSLLKFSVVSTNGTTSKEETEKPSEIKGEPKTTSLLLEDNDKAEITADDNIRKLSKLSTGEAIPKETSLKSPMKDVLNDKSPSREYEEQKPTDEEDELIRKLSVVCTKDKTPEQEEIEKSIATKEEQTIISPLIEDRDKKTVASDETIRKMSTISTGDGTPKGTLTESPIKDDLSIISPSHEDDEDKPTDEKSESIRKLSVVSTKDTTSKEGIEKPSDIKGEQKITLPLLEEKNQTKIIEDENIWKTSNINKDQVTSKDTPSKSAVNDDLHDKSPLHEDNVVEYVDDKSELIRQFSMVSATSKKEVEKQSEIKEEQKTASLLHEDKYKNTITANETVQSMSTISTGELTPFQSPIKDILRDKSLISDDVQKHSDEKADSYRQLTMVSAKDTTPEEEIEKSSAIKNDQTIITTSIVDKQAIVEDQTVRKMSIISTGEVTPRDTLTETPIKDDLNDKSPSHEEDEVEPAHEKSESGLKLSVVSTKDTLSKQDIEKPIHRNEEQKTRSPLLEDKDKTEIIVLDENIRKMSTESTDEMTSKDMPIEPPIEDFLSDSTTSDDGKKPTETKAESVRKLSVVSTKDITPETEIAKSPDIKNDQTIIPTFIDDRDKQEISEDKTVKKMSTIITGEVTPRDTFTKTSINDKSPSHVGDECGPAKEKSESIRKLSVASTMDSTCKQEIKITSDIKGEQKTTSLLLDDKDKTEITADENIRKMSTISTGEVTPKDTSLQSPIKDKPLSHEDDLKKNTNEKAEATRKLSVVSTKDTTPEEEIDKSSLNDDKNKQEISEDETVRKMSTISTNEVTPRDTLTELLSKDVLHDKSPSHEDDEGAQADEKSECIRKLSVVSASCKEDIEKSLHSKGEQKTTSPLLEDIDKTEITVDENSQQMSNITTDEVTPKDTPSKSPITDVLGDKSLSHEDDVKKLTDEKAESTRKLSAVSTKDTTPEEEIEKSSLVDDRDKQAISEDGTVRKMSTVSTSEVTPKNTLTESLIKDVLNDKSPSHEDDHGEPGDEKSESFRKLSVTMESTSKEEFEIPFYIKEEQKTTSPLFDDKDKSKITTDENIRKMSVISTGEMTPKVTPLQSPINDKSTSHEDDIKKLTDEKAESTRKLSVVSTKDTTPEEETDKSSLNDDKNKQAFSEDETVRKMSISTNEVTPRDTLTELPIKDVLHDKSPSHEDNEGAPADEESESIRKLSVVSASCKEDIEIKSHMKEDQKTTSPLVEDIDKTEITVDENNQQMSNIRTDEVTPKDTPSKSPIKYVLGDKSLSHEDDVKKLTDEKAESTRKLSVVSTKDTTPEEEIAKSSLVDDRAKQAISEDGTVRKMSTVSTSEVTPKNTLTESPIKDVLNEQSPSHEDDHGEAADEKSESFRKLSVTTDSTSKDEFEIPSYIKEEQKTTSLLLDDRDKLEIITDENIRKISVISTGEVTPKVTPLQSPIKDKSTSHEDDVKKLTDEKAESTRKLSVVSTKDTTPEGEIEKSSFNDDRDKQAISEDDTVRKMSTISINEGTPPDTLTELLSKDVLHDKSPSHEDDEGAQADEKSECIRKLSVVSASCKEDIEKSLHTKGEQKTTSPLLEDIDKTEITVDEIRRQMSNMSTDEVTPKDTPSKLPIKDFLSDKSLSHEDDVKKLKDEKAEPTRKLSVGSTKDTTPEEEIEKPSLVDDRDKQAISEDGTARKMSTISTSEVTAENTLTESPIKDVLNEQSPSHEDDHGEPADEKSESFRKLSVTTDSTSKDEFEIPTYIKEEQKTTSPLLEDRDKSEIITDENIRKMSVISTGEVTPKVTPLQSPIKDKSTSHEDDVKKLTDEKAESTRKLSVVSTKDTTNEEEIEKSSLNDDRDKLAISEDQTVRKMTTISTSEVTAKNTITESPIKDVLNDKSPSHDDDEEEPANKKSESFRKLSVTMDSICKEQFEIPSDIKEEQKTTSPLLDDKDKSEITADKNIRKMSVISTGEVTPKVSPLQSPINDKATSHEDNVKKLTAEKSQSTQKLSVVSTKDTTNEEEIEKSSLNDDRDKLATSEDQTVRKMSIISTSEVPAKKSLTESPIKDVLNDKSPSDDDDEEVPADEKSESFRKLSVTMDSTCKEQFEIPSDIKEEQKTTSPLLDDKDKSEITADENIRKMSVISTGELTPKVSPLQSPIKDIATSHEDDVKKLTAEKAQSTQKMSVVSTKDTTPEEEIEKSSLIDDRGKQAISEDGTVRTISTISTGEVTSESALTDSPIEDVLSDKSPSHDDDEGKLADEKSESVRKLSAVSTMDSTCKEEFEIPSDIKEEQKTTSPLLDDKHKTNMTAEDNVQNLTIMSTYKLTSNDTTSKLPMKDGHSDKSPSREDDKAKSILKSSVVSTEDTTPENEIVKSLAIKATADSEEIEISADNTIRKMSTISTDKVTSPIKVVLNDESPSHEDGKGKPADEKSESIRKLSVVNTNDTISKEKIQKPLGIQGEHQITQTNITEGENITTKSTTHTDDVAPKDTPLRSQIKDVVDEQKHTGEKSEIIRKLSVISMKDKAPKEEIEMSSASEENQKIVSPSLDKSVISLDENIRKMSTVSSDEATDTLMTNAEADELKPTDDQSESIRKLSVVSTRVTISKEEIEDRDKTALTEEENSPIKDVISLSHENDDDKATEEESESIRKMSVASTKDTISKEDFEKSSAIKEDGASLKGGDQTEILADTNNKKMSPVSIENVAPKDTFTKSPIKNSIEDQLSSYLHDDEKHAHEDSESNLKLSVLSTKDSPCKEEIERSSSRHTHQPAITNDVTDIKKSTISTGAITPEDRLIKSPIKGTFSDKSPSLEDDIEKPMNEVAQSMRQLPVVSGKATSSAIKEQQTIHSLLIEDTEKLTMIADETVRITSTAIADEVIPKDDLIDKLPSQKENAEKSDSIPKISVVSTNNTSSEEEIKKSLDIKEDQNIISPLLVDGDKSANSADETIRKMSAVSTDQVTPDEMLAKSSIKDVLRDKSPSLEDDEEKPTEEAESIRKLSMVSAKDTSKEDIIKSPAIKEDQTTISPLIKERNKKIISPDDTIRIVSPVSSDVNTDVTDPTKKNGHESLPFVTTKFIESETIMSEIQHTSNDVSSSVSSGTNITNNMNIASSIDEGGYNLNGLNKVDNVHTESKHSSHLETKETSEKECLLSRGISSEEVSKEFSCEEKYKFESDEKHTRHTSDISLDKIPKNQTVILPNEKLKEDSESSDIKSITKTFHEKDVRKNVPSDYIKNSVKDEQIDSIQGSILIDKTSSVSSSHTKHFDTKDISEHKFTKLGETDELGSPKEDIPISEASDSGIHSIPTDIETIVDQTDSHLSVFETIEEQLIKDKTNELLEGIEKAFSNGEVQQGIKTETLITSLQESHYDGVSTPPTVPVSPLPKSQEKIPDLNMQTSSTKEMSSDSIDETVTKIVHVGDDVVTQRISTSTEKLQRPRRNSDAESIEQSESLSSMQQSVGKLKTETDTVTKVIKEGENVVTQTITTVTTKEIISRDDGTPQNIKTTIETTTLSKSSDGSTTTTKDTQTLLSECSSSLRSSSLMDETSFIRDDEKHTKELKEDSSLRSSSRDPSETYLSQTVPKPTEKTVTKQTDSITRDGILITKTITTTTMREYITDNNIKKIKETIETLTELEYPNGKKESQKETKVNYFDLPEKIIEDFEDNVEDTTIDTDVSKKIVTENGISIILTITTETKRETHKAINGRKCIKTTIETTTTKESPDGSSTTEKEVMVKTEQLPERVVTELDSILEGYVMDGQPEEYVTEDYGDIWENGLNIRRKIVTKIKKINFSDSQGILKKNKTVTETTTTDNFPDGSSQSTVDTNTTVEDAILEEKVDPKLSSELQGFTFVESKTVDVETKENDFILQNEAVKQKITITTTKEMLISDNKSKRKLKTTTETITQNEFPNGLIEVSKEVKISLSDCTESDSEDFNEYDEIGETEENVTKETETLFENNICIKRTITIITRRQELNHKINSNTKIRTTILTITEDEYPDGSVKTNKSEKVTVTDVFLKTPSPEKASKYTDEDIEENIEDSTTDVEVKQDYFKRDGNDVKRTITTRTKRDTLSTSNELIKRIKTTVETTTVDAFSDGSSETTKDVKITLSEVQKTSDSNLNAALQDLRPTGKIKKFGDIKTDTKSVDNRQVLETITTNVIKEEFLNVETNEFAVKTVTEVTTDSQSQDGSIETSKDVRTQISYLPIGTTMDDLSPEELEDLEKQPSPRSEISNLGEIHSRSHEDFKQNEELIKQKIKPRSPLGEITTDTDTYTKVVKDGDSEITQTVNVITTKEVIGPEKLKTTVETTTISKGIDGVTKTTKSTKTTISEFTEEFEESVDTGGSEKSSSKHELSKISDFRSSSAASDELEHHGIASPPSATSSGQASRAATQPWGADGYSDEEDGAGSPSSVKSQIPHSPRSNLSFELSDSNKPHDRLSPDHIDDILKSPKFDPMSMSTYGELPEDDSRSSTTFTETRTKQATAEHSSSTQSMITEKDSSIHSTDSNSTKFLDEADQHFERAIEEHKKVCGSDLMSNITAKYEFDTKSSESFQTKGTKEMSVIILGDLKVDTKKVTEETSSEKSSSSSKSESQSTSEQSVVRTKEEKDPIESWGKPLGLPSPGAPPTLLDGKGTPKKQAPLSSTVLNKNKLNQEKSERARRVESPSKKKRPAPVYMELTYVPHHGNSYYAAVEFFKRVRARYYVFSGTEPSKEIYNALLDAKKTWEDKDLEVTIIPTYDTDVLGYWVTENEEALEKYHIDLSPSASRCTINLQDHETSCAAYRLEF